MRFLENALPFITGGKNCSSQPSESAGTEVTIADFSQPAAMGLGERQLPLFHYAHGQGGVCPH
jgi:hypothetical protein